MVFEFGLFGWDGHSTALAHGEYWQMNNHADWHMQDDPWGAYLQSDGNPATQASNPQGHTQWTPVTNETWENYNVTSGPYAVSAPTHTTHLATAHNVAHTTKLDGGGEYWDANILERPDNTASGTLFNPPDDESCCGIAYHAHSSHNTMLSHVAPPADGMCQACGHHTAGAHMQLCCCDMGVTTTQQALAVPPVGAEATHHAATKAARPSPAHYLLALHSCSLGALEATGDVCSKVLKGEAREDLGGMWQSEFKARAKANASAISPIAGHIVAGV